MKAAYAYFPGTGPNGRTCGDCKHFRARGRSTEYGVCDWVRQRMTAAPIRSYIDACKYFEQRPPRPARPIARARVHYVPRDHTATLVKARDDTTRPGLTKSQIDWFLNHPGVPLSPRLERQCRVLVRSVYGEKILGQYDEKRRGESVGVNPTVLGESWGALVAP